MGWGGGRKGILCWEENCVLKLSPFVPKSRKFQKALSLVKEPGICFYISLRSVWLFMSTLKRWDPFWFDFVLVCMIKHELSTQNLSISLGFWSWEMGCIFSQVGCACVVWSMLCGSSVVPDQHALARQL